MDEHRDTEHERAETVGLGVVILAWHRCRAAMMPRWQLPLTIALVAALASAQASAQPQGDEPAPAPGEPTPRPDAPDSSAPDAATAPAPAEPGSGEPTPALEVAAPSTPDAGPAPTGTGEPVPAPAAAAAAAESAEAKADTAAAVTSEAATVNELGAIIVSARRRNESVQEVPVAVSALSGDALESKGAVNLDSFHKEVPSVTSYSANARNTTINIRGLGTGIALTGSGLDSGVGFYVDDVYYGRLSQSILNLVDLDRIEVLRGPQGTLFGRNTTAGAISVVTRAPSFSQEGSADLSIGNYRYLQARGSLSGPIFANKLAARVSFEAQRRDGFLINTNQLGRLHNQESFSVRGQLLYQPTEALKVRLIGDFATLGQTCCTTTPIGAVTAFDGGTPIAYPFANRAAQLGYTPLPYDPAARRTDADRQRVFRVVLGGVSLRADWDRGSHTLTSISALRFWNTSPRNDGDGTALDVFRESNQDDRQRQFTEELRVASNGTNAIDYVAGLYFLHQHLPSYLRRDYGPQAGEYLIAPGTSDLTPEQRRDALKGAYMRGPSTADTLNGAAFGQATWHIFSSLDLTAGLRYTYERKSGHYQQTRGSRQDISGLSEAQLALYNAYTPVVPYYELDKSWNSVSGLATVSQKLGSDALIFATYSRGSKSGGINLTSLPLDENGQVRTGLAILKPETVDHFEVGLKSQWFGRRFTANLNVFHTEIRDYQNTITDQTGSVFRWYLSNVGKVRSKGVEVELRAVPVKGLSLYAAGTYNPTEYTSYKNAQCPWEARAPGKPVVCDLSGQQLPVAPKYSASAGGDLTVELTEQVNLFFGADYSYRSSYTTTTNNSRYSRVNPVGLINARLGLKDAGGRWDAVIWSRNLLDSLYFLSKGVDEQTGIHSGLLGDPRTFGGTVRYYFD